MSYDQPDSQALAGKLQSKKHVTRHKLWMDYLSQPCPTDKTKYQYSQFCSGLNEFLRANDLVEIVTHEPGQELYVDWAGDKVPVVDQASGDTTFKASLFVAVSPYSGLMHVTAAANEKMPAWIECHVKALNYLGKLPAVIVPDNASTATYRPKKHSGYRMVTDRYAAFADYYGVTIVPTRPGRPRTQTIGHSRWARSTRITVGFVVLVPVPYLSTHTRSVLRLIPKSSETTFSDTSGLFSYIATASRLN